MAILRDQLAVTEVLEEVGCFRTEVIMRLTRRHTEGIMADESNDVLSFTTVDTGKVALSGCITTLHMKHDTRIGRWFRPCQANGLPNQNQSSLESCPTI